MSLNLKKQVQTSQKWAPTKDKTQYKVEVKVIKLQFKAKSKKFKFE